MIASDDVPALRAAIRLGSARITKVAWSPGHPERVYNIDINWDYFGWANSELGDELFELQRQLREKTLLIAVDGIEHSIPIPDAEGDEYTSAELVQAINASVPGVTAHVVDDGSISIGVSGVDADALVSGFKQGTVCRVK